MLLGHRMPVLKILNIWVDIVVSGARGRGRPFRLFLSPIFSSLLHRLCLSVLYSQTAEPTNHNRTSFPRIAAPRSAFISTVFHQSGLVGLTRLQSRPNEQQGENDPKPKSTPDADVGELGPWPLSPNFHRATSPTTPHLY